MDPRNTTPPAHVHDQLCGCGDASAPSLYDEHDERAACTPGTLLVSPVFHRIETVRDGNLIAVANLEGSTLPAEEKEAYARFIVTACNSHEELLGLLERITRSVRMKGPAGTTAYLISDDIMEAALAAVAKAR